MTIYEFGITDFRCIVAGAAIPGSGGSGSYSDAAHVAEAELYNAVVVIASFAGLLHGIGYAGALPYPEPRRHG